MKYLFSVLPIRVHHYILQVSVIRKLPIRGTALTSLTFDEPTSIDVSYVDLLPQYLLSTDTGDRDTETHTYIYMSICYLYFISTYLEILGLLWLLRIL